MLDKKAIELTNAILDNLNFPHSTSHFIAIHTVICKALEAVYLQGREDQIHRVPFEQEKNGTLKFLDK